MRKGNALYIVTYQLADCSHSAVKCLSVYNFDANVSYTDSGPLDISLIQVIITIVNELRRSIHDEAT